MICLNHFFTPTYAWIYIILDHAYMSWCVQNLWTDFEASGAFYILSTRYVCRNLAHIEAANHNYVSNLRQDLPPHIFWSQNILRYRVSIYFYVFFFFDRCYWKPRGDWVNQMKPKSNKMNFKTNSFSTNNFYDVIIVLMENFKLLCCLLIYPCFMDFILSMYQFFDIYI